MRPLVPVILVVALAFAPARAEHCIWITSPEVDAFGFYVDNDLCQPECLVSVAIYQESNGIGGLQPDDPEGWCLHPWESPDTRVV